MGHQEKPAETRRRVPAAVIATMPVPAVITGYYQEMKKGADDLGAIVLYAEKPGEVAKARGVLNAFIHLGVIKGDQLKADAEFRHLDDRGRLNRKDPTVAATMALQDFLIGEKLLPKDFRKKPYYGLFDDSTAKAVKAYAERKMQKADVSRADFEKMFKSADLVTRKAMAEELIAATGKRLAAEEAAVKFAREDIKKLVDKKQEMRLALGTANYGRVVELYFETDKLITLAASRKPSAAPVATPGPTPVVITQTHGGAGAVVPVPVKKAAEEARRRVGADMLALKQRYDDAVRELYISGALVAKSTDEKALRDIYFGKGARPGKYKKNSFTGYYLEAKKQYDQAMKLYAQADAAASEAKRKKLEKRADAAMKKANAALEKAKKEAVKMDALITKVRDAYAKRKGTAGAAVTTAEWEAARRAAGVLADEVGRKLVSVATRIGQVQLPPDSDIPFRYGEAMKLYRDGKFAEAKKALEGIEKDLDKIKDVREGAVPAAKAAAEKELQKARDMVTGDAELPGITVDGSSKIPLSPAAKAWAEKELEPYTKKVEEADKLAQQGKYLEAVKAYNEVVAMLSDPATRQKLTAVKNVAASMSVLDRKRTELDEKKAGFEKVKKDLDSKARDDYQKQLDAYEAALKKLEADQAAVLGNYNTKKYDDAAKGAYQVLLGVGLLPQLGPVPEAANYIYQQGELKMSVSAKSYAGMPGMLVSFSTTVTSAGEAPLVDVLAQRGTEITFSPIKRGSDGRAFVLLPDTFRGDRGGVTASAYLSGNKVYIYVREGKLIDAVSGESNYGSDDRIKRIEAGTYTQTVAAGVEKYSLSLGNLPAQYAPYVVGRLSGTEIMARGGRPGKSDRSMSFTLGAASGIEMEANTGYTLDYSIYFQRLVKVKTE